MEYCDDCGSAMVPNEDVWQCMKCDFEKERETADETEVTEPPNDAGDMGGGPTTELERLETTDTGAVKKKDAMRWLEGRDAPTPAEFKDAMVPKPEGFTGSKFPTDISTIRVTGDPEFIETVAGLFTPVLDMEDYRTYVEINLQQAEDKDTGELTDNYALYLSVAERSG